MKNGINIQRKNKNVINPHNRAKDFSKLLSLRLSGYLMDVGWFSAIKNGEPVDKNFEPLQWLTYPYIDFITERPNKEFIVFV